MKNKEVRNKINIDIADDYDMSILINNIHVALETNIGTSAIDEIEHVYNVYVAAKTNTD